MGRSRGVISSNVVVVDWSFRSVFDRVVPRACPAATSSLIRVDLSSVEGTGYTLTPEPSGIINGSATFAVTEGSYSPS